MKMLSIAIVAVFLAGCTTGPIIAPCAGACVGPYDVSLSSHREALGASTD